ncbi:MAG: endonuclease/exonuclease/phosphatase family protein [Bacteroidota bacterium]
MEVDQPIVTKKKSNFIRLLILINIGLAFFLLCVQLSSKISPESFWVFEPLSYTYPFVVIINILFLLFWTIRRSKYAFISLAVIIMGYDKFALMYQPPLFVMESPVSKNQFKVMSYNVRLFDLYNWSGNLKTRSEIFDMLKKESPQVVCFQEYYHSDEKDFSNNDTISALLNLKYKQIEYGLTLHKNYHWGLATFSNYPIINKGLLFFTPGSTNFGMYCDVLYNNDTVRVYNVHLQSNHLKKKDYVFIDHPQINDQEKFLEGSLSIFKQIKKGAAIRSTQVDELSANIENCPYPIIVCGDFNDPPYSYAYNKISQHLDDCFLDKGKGFGISYNGSFIPYRIDYILHSNYFECLKYSMVRKKLSDHYPIVVTLKPRAKH